jgi:hypothetical protein
VDNRGATAADGGDNHGRLHTLAKYGLKKQPRLIPHQRDINLDVILATTPHFAPCSET